MPCERKLSLQEPEALVALFVPIWRWAPSVANVEREWNLLLFDMAVFMRSLVVE